MQGAAERVQAVAAAAELELVQEALVLVVQEPAAVAQEALEPVAEAEAEPPRSGTVCSSLLRPPRGSRWLVPEDHYYTAHSVGPGLDPQSYSP